MERLGETSGDTKGAGGVPCPQSPCSLSDAAWGGAWSPCCVYTPVHLYQPHTSKRGRGETSPMLFWAENCCHRHARAGLGRRWVPQLDLNVPSVPLRLSITPQESRSARESNRPFGSMRHYWSLSSLALSLGHLWPSSWGSHPSTHPSTHTHTHTYTHSLLICFSFFLFKINFYWSIATSQCYVSFCCTAKWISCMYTYIPSLLDFLPIGHHRALSRTPWDIQ